MTTLFTTAYSTGYAARRELAAVNLAGAGVQRGEGSTTAPCPTGRGVSDRFTHDWCTATTAGEWWR